MNKTSKSTAQKIPLVKSKSRIRKSTKLTNDKKELYKLAWNDVKEGRSNIYQAAKRYDINQSTLWYWCQRDDVDHSAPSVGRPCYLGKHLEEKMKNWMFEAAKSGNLFAGCYFLNSTLFRIF